VARLTPPRPRRRRWRGGLSRPLAVGNVARVRRHAAPAGDDRQWRRESADDVYRKVADGLAKEAYRVRVVGLRLVSWRLAMLRDLEK
jgi:hypothetical protein